MLSTYKLGGRGCLLRDKDWKIRKVPGKVPDKGHGGGRGTGEGDDKIEKKLKIRHFPFFRVGGGEGNGNRCQRRSLPPKRGIGIRKRRRPYQGKSCGNKVSGKIQKHTNRQNNLLKSLNQGVAKIPRVEENKTPNYMFGR